MKILEINNEWRIAVDNNFNYMPERYVIREGGQFVGGKETKAFEGWERQKDVYLSNEMQALVWMAKKVNLESGPQKIIDSFVEVNKKVRELLRELEQINGST